MPLGFLKNPAFNLLGKGLSVPGEKKNFVHVVSSDESFLQNGKGNSVNHCKDPLEEATASYL